MECCGLAWLWLGLAWLGLPSPLAHTCVQEALSRIAAIEDQMHVNREKALADAEFYRVSIHAAMLCACVTTTDRHATQQRHTPPHTATHHRLRRRPMPTRTFSQTSSCGTSRSCHWATTPRFILASHCPPCTSTDLPVLPTLGPCQVDSRGCASKLG